MCAPDAGRHTDRTVLFYMPGSDPPIEDSGIEAHNMPSTKRTAIKPRATRCPRLIFFRNAPASRKN